MSLEINVDDILYTFPSYIEEWALNAPILDEYYTSFIRDVRVYNINTNEYETRNISIFDTDRIPNFSIDCVGDNISLVVEEDREELDCNEELLRRSPRNYVTEQITYIEITRGIARKIIQRNADIVDFTQYTKSNWSSFSTEEKEEYFALWFHAGYLVWAVAAVDI